MTVNELKNQLAKMPTISFQLPDGSLVPNHFHVTEVGKVTKHFIDCGGTERMEEVCSLQLWEADDYDHRLHPEKLVSIITLSQDKLGIGDLPVEVEYQGTTIGRYDLTLENGSFHLINKKTTCLAQDQCGVPTSKSDKQMVDLSGMAADVCTPGSGCC